MIFHVNIDTYIAKKLRMKEKKYCDASCKSVRKASLFLNYPTQNVPFVDTSLVVPFFSYQPFKKTAIFFFEVASVRKKLK